MSRVVVDASVVVKWLVPETHAEKALTLLTGGYEMVAPDMLYPEVGNVLWKKVNRVELNETEAQELLDDFARIPIQIFRSALLLQDTWTISRQTNRSFYDSLYLALARARSCPMVTADLKLYNALKSGPLKKLAMWVGDIPDA